MNFQMAFYKYSCHLQDVLKTHASSRGWIDEDSSYRLKDGAWRLMSGNAPIATVLNNGNVLIH